MKYPVPIVVSLDRSPMDAVYAMAEKMPWMRFLIDKSDKIDCVESQYQSLSGGIVHYDVVFDLTEETMALYALLHGEEIHV